MQSGQLCVFTDNNSLSFLSSAKLGATEQRWASQLVAFIFEMRYQSCRSNQKKMQLLFLDSMSLAPAWQNVCCSGLLFQSRFSRNHVQDRCHLQLRETRAFPSHSLGDICTLQESDPLLWDLLCQCYHLVEKDGILYCRISLPDGGEEVLQLVLPEALKSETLR